MIDVDTVVTDLEADRANLEAIVWDAYKDLHGVRPRHLNFNEFNDAELEEYAENLFHGIEVEAVNQAKWHEEEERLRKEQEAREAIEAAQTAFMAPDKYEELAILAGYAA